MVCCGSLALVFLFLFRLPKAMLSLCTYFELQTPHEEIKFEDDFESLNVQNESESVFVISCFIMNI